MVTTLDGITMTIDNRGCITYQLPQTCHGEYFDSWKRDHKAEIDRIRNTVKKSTSKEAI